MLRLKPRNLIVGLVFVGVFIAVGLLLFQDNETPRVRTPIAATDPHFPVYLARLLGSPLTSGDDYRIHRDAQAFPPMLAAIHAARARVRFETYIYDSGEAGELFTAAFEQAARRGVDVRMVLDAFGAQNIDPDHLTRLEVAGVQIGWFNPVRYVALEEANYRTHRKALVVDGDVAFVGGVGVGDQWLRDTGDYPVWRDTQIEVRGPAAIDIEAAFNENWIETGGVVEPDLLEHAEPAGTAQSIVVWSSPAGGTNSMKLLYLLSIAAARRSIDIQSPYLLTDASTRWTLQEAASRGVRMRLLAEGEITDAKPVKFAGRADYAWMMERGMEVYEYVPTMMHAKVMVVDGVLSIAGSANFGNRSLELNDELNVAIFDPAVAAELTADFERDLRHSVKLDPDAWRARPFHIRARDRLWSFFGELF